MRPDAQLAMRVALEHGPSHCPPDLFEGSVASVIRGLKAHANTIAHARHVALEQTYPRTRALTGERFFHLVAKKHLADPAALRLPHRLIGEGFAARLSGAARDLAAIEWAWLEAYGAPDAPSFDLAAIAGLDAAALAAATVAVHPAARLIAIDRMSPLNWEDATFYSTHALVTRPHAEVFVTGVGHSIAALLHVLDRPRPLGELLERDSAAATALVTAGALTLSTEISL